MMNKKVNDEPR
jgi:hypothetical protein